eukprot:scaffold2971_cov166-Skeletonema_marinoi.AAC.3
MFRSVRRSGLAGPSLPSQQKFDRSKPAIFPIGEDSARNLALILDKTSLESISLEYNDLAGEDFCKEIATALGRQTRLKNCALMRIGLVESDACYLGRHSRDREYQT